MPFNRRADEFHDENGLANPCAAEHGGFSARYQWGEQVDDLDAGVKNLQCPAKSVNSRCLCMDGTTLDVCRKSWSAVDGLTERVQETPQYCVADRRGDRRA